VPPSVCRLFSISDPYSAHIQNVINISSTSTDNQQPTEGNSPLPGNLSLALPENGVSCVYDGGQCPPYAPADGSAMACA
jgi:hypothetical protein